MNIGMRYAICGMQRYVDLKTGQVNIKGISFDMEKIRTGITGIGYKVIEEAS
jgi:hypothetical protein